MSRKALHLWADGIHVQARLEDDAQCQLVIIGAAPEGKKKLVGFIDGVRGSAQSWRELLLDLKPRARDSAPARVADGALGFWRERRRCKRTGATYPWIVQSTAMVNHYYFYCVDADFGPLFVKFCSYCQALHQRPRVPETPVYQVRHGVRASGSSPAPILSCCSGLPMN